jgi:hypothetical protein
MMNDKEFKDLHDDINSLTWLVGFMMEKGMMPENLRLILLDKAQRLLDQLEED